MENNEVIRKAVEKCGCEIRFLAVAAGPDGWAAVSSCGEDRPVEAVKDDVDGLCRIVDGLGRDSITVVGGDPGDVSDLLRDILGEDSELLVDGLVLYGVPSFSSPVCTDPSVEDCMTSLELLMEAFVSDVDRFGLRVEVLNTFDMGYGYLSSPVHDIVAEVLGVRKGCVCDRCVCVPERGYLCERSTLPDNGIPGPVMTLEIGGMPLSSACRELGLPYAEDVGYLEALRDEYHVEDPRRRAVEAVLYAVPMCMDDRDSTLYYPGALKGLESVRDRHISDLVGELGAEGCPLVFSDGRKLVLVASGDRVHRIVEDWSEDTGIPVRWTDTVPADAR